MEQIFYETMVTGKKPSAGRRYENFNSFAAAECSARAMVRVNDGRVVEITMITRHFKRGTMDRMRLATVRADALGRIWTDSNDTTGLI